MFQWQQEKYECDFLFGPGFNSISPAFRTRIYKNELYKKLKKTLENYDWIATSFFI